MHGDISQVNGTIAPLRNVALLAQLVERVQNRSRGLPGLATFCGASGLGKSTAAIYAVNKHRAYHVQMKSVWTRKKLCASILGEMGIRSTGTLSDMADLIGEQLSLSRRPLIIDEADFLVQKKQIEIVRDIYEMSLGTVILIGEEQLPQKLKAWERIHGRMLEWVHAVSASLADARHLAALYCPKVQVGDDLLTAIHDASTGSVRRICVNLDRVRERAETIGKTKIGLDDFGGDFFTGNPPTRRAA